MRDALLELPPTSEKLTISFSPAPEPPEEEEDEMDEYELQRRREGEQGETVPLFRLEATGANGSGEVIAFTSTYLSHRSRELTRRTFVVTFLDGLFS